VTNNKENCLDCARLLDCSATSEICERYEYAEPDKNASTTRYIKAVQKLNEAIIELKQAEIGMKIFEKAAADKELTREAKRKSEEKTT
jgi:hypothetical protein